MKFTEMSADELLKAQSIYGNRFSGLCKENYRLLLTRGKPCSEQLELSMGLLDALRSDSSILDEDGNDCRNYGIGDGLTEMKKLFGELLGVPYDSVITGNNSSLNVMFDVVSFAVTHGFAGCKPWCRQENVKFLCPAPGYDRHFAVTEYFGIEMITVPMLKTGPDMDIVEKLVQTDPAVKGIWCVPKYSNPTGITFSDETVRRLASLKPAAEDFRIFWDNAYCVHDLKDTSDKLLNLYEECKKRGTLSLPIMFASTSKITFAGGGVSALAAWETNISDLRGAFSKKTIGPDKINQLRHIRYLKNIDGVLSLMKKHRTILQPKFEAVSEVFEKELGGKGIAEWTEPRGGYFISVDVLSGCAKRVTELCREAGVTLNAPGSTYPYGIDPNDSNIRIAPSYPDIDELKKSAEIFSVCVCCAAIEKLLAN